MLLISRSAKNKDKDSSLGCGRGIERGAEGVEGAEGPRVENGGVGHGVVSEHGRRRFGELGDRHSAPRRGATKFNIGGLLRRISSRKGSDKTVSQGRVFPNGGADGEEGNKGFKLGRRLPGSMVLGKSLTLNKPGVESGLQSGVEPGLVPGVEPGVDAAQEDASASLTSTLLATEATEQAHQNTNYNFLNTATYKGSHSQGSNGVLEMAIEESLDSEFTARGHNERYPSLTSKCISLPNSEMTSRIELETQSVNQYIHPQVSQQEMLGISNNLDSAVVDWAAASGGHKQEQNVFRNFDDYEDLDVVSDLTTTQQVAGVNGLDELDGIDEQGECDITTYLSESESDLNFDPRHEESVHDYKKGGYHPVAKGETYYSDRLVNREYIALRKLGWGHFSTVWLAKSRYNPTLSKLRIYRDLPPNEEHVDNQEEFYVAIKFVKSNENYIEAAEDEIKLLKTLDKPLVYGNHLNDEQKAYFNDFRFNDNSQPVGHPGYKHTMKLIDDFEMYGPNGRHICMVLEVLGENILNVLHKYKHYQRGRMDGSRDKGDSDNDIKFDKQEPNPFGLATKSKLSLGLTGDVSGGKKQEKSVESNASSMQNNSISSSMSISSASSSDSFIRLLSVLKAYGGLPLSIVRQVVKQILLAGDYIHHCGVIHTDLKPENILIEIKDINKLIKRIENEKVSKFQAKYKNSNNNSVSSSNFSLKSIFDPPMMSRKSTTATMGSYRKSRMSISGKLDTPIRTSKPLSAAMTSNPFFKDVFLNKTRTNYSAISKCATDRSISPTNRAVKPESEDFKVDDNLISIKIADLGNATFHLFHFTNQIQTRQYRSPEILLQHKTWGASTDLWSIGCIMFELITGDYLFEPHSGSNFDKDDDHLAQIIELLGSFPSESYLLNCKLRDTYLGKDDEGIYYLKNIRTLKFWSLEDVFVEKYKMDRDDIATKLITDFILKCLSYELDERYDCKSLLQHPWLLDNYDFTKFDLKSLNQLPNNHLDVPGFIS